MEQTTMQTQLDFEPAKNETLQEINIPIVTPIAESAAEKTEPPKKKRGGYHGGHRPKTLPEGARRHSIWSTEEEFAELKGFLASYRLKAKEAAPC